MHSVMDSLVSYLGAWDDNADHIIPHSAEVNFDAAMAILDVLETSVQFYLSALPELVRRKSGIEGEISTMRMYANDRHWTNVYMIAKNRLPVIVSNAENDYIEWIDHVVDYDAQLRQDISGLLVAQQLDCAERKAFVILKERLVDIACALGEGRTAIDGKDGNDLVGRIFGAGKLVARSGRMDDADREALLHLLRGLYETFRNVVDHNDVVVPWHEAEAVISMVNWVLLKLTAIAPTVRDAKGEAGKTE